MTTTTTTITFGICKSNVKAVYRAMPSNDIRHYLNGMLVQHNGTNTRLICTDGHRIHMVQEAGNNPAGAMIEFILPAAQVMALVKGKDQGVFLSYDTATKKISIQTSTGTTTVDPVDGKFPDYLRVLAPASGTLTPELAAINPEYVLDADLSLRDYLGISKKTMSPVAICQRGDNVAVLAYENFMAGIMPLRSSAVKPCDAINPDLLKSL